MKNLRVYIDKGTHEIYEKLVKRGSENPDDFPFQTMKDLFMVAACLGAKETQYEEIDSAKDIFNADVFDENIDIPVLSSLAYLYEKKLVVLNDSKRILEIAQGYANGGIHLLKEQLLNNPGRPLNNLIEIITLK
jgi:dnd system-associated protein 4